eukprot:GEZU01016025.1.p1 GENE.GEZU01016025.1~~GEZU01016025.1.p1  ORF type:complete len:360 (-),score=37.91 GEZU01016025.1:13-1092(-)
MANGLRKLKANKKTKHAFDDYKFDVRVMMSHLLGKHDLIFTQEEAQQVLSSEQADIFQSMIQRRCQNEPLQYIIGTWGFYSLEFKVTPDVLIPRPDSETIIEAVKSVYGKEHRDRSLNILDIGTGSGCLLLTLLHEYPKARGVGIDISTKALEVARQNSESLRLDDRCQLLHIAMQDIQRYLSNTNGGGNNESNDSVQLQQLMTEALSRRPPFDIIVSNPPYIPSSELRKGGSETTDTASNNASNSNQTQAPAVAGVDMQDEVIMFEPLTALDGGEDGLDYYRILANVLSGLLSTSPEQRNAPSSISPHAFLEIGHDQSAAVQAIMNATGSLRVVGVHKDLQAIDRCIVVAPRFNQDHD